jgi:hypothetical protein
MLLDKLKEMLTPKYTMKFEPHEPIINVNDFTMELIKYCDEEKKDLVILKEGMVPIVKIDGEKYFGQLEPPRMLPLVYVNTMGFRWVYLYHYNETEV